MATYIMFGKYSRESIEHISAQRTKQSSELFQKNGGALISGYALLGKTDLVLIAEFPDTKKAMKASVELSKLSGISFTTAPAISVEDFDRLMG